MRSTYNSKTDVIEDITSAFAMVTEVCRNIPNDRFETKSHGKWSAKENLEHLILSSRPVAKALKLPKLTFLAFGKSKQGSGSFDQLVNAYQTKLEEGGTATSKYVPAENPSNMHKNQLLEEWDNTKRYLIKNLERWSEQDLDTYRMPHPLLGKITVREMLYFTIYHSHHHLKSIKAHTGNT